MVLVLIRGCPHRPAGRTVGRVVTRPAKTDNVVRYRTTELRPMELESPAWTLVPPLRLSGAFR
jgi:hypothetical protein